MQTVLITGGTGMIGQTLANTLLDKGYSVIILTRTQKQSSRTHLTFAQWNVDQGYIDPLAIQTADIIVHLAGESVATKRWTKKRKKEIVDSRVQSGALLVKALKEHAHHVHTVIAASAIGWYGPDTPASLLNGFVESDPVDHAFLGATCKAWEESVHPIANLGIRLVQYRIGIVLNKRGGALAEFIKPAQLGVAAILGTGKQIVSWIHYQDLCNLFVFSMEHKNIQGIYNAVAPDPVENKKLVELISRKTTKYFIPIKVPSFVLKIILGEMSIEVLKSAKVSSAKIQSEGFEFAYPRIEMALDNLLKK
jgi:uncharacterized protein (TIGR01777 family)